MKRFHGPISVDYHLVPQTVPSYFELEESLARRIALQYSNPVVVDIGVGTGITTKAILAANAGSVVRAVDDERSMIDQAKAKLCSEVSAGDVDLHHSDAVDYFRTLPGASVDVVASSYTIHNCVASYRAVLHAEVFRILKRGGMFINNDKYASDDRCEYFRELADQIIRYDLLAEVGRLDLRRIWVEHEIEDQIPERIMWAQQSLDELTDIGFVNAQLVERIGQYAILTAYKSYHLNNTLSQ